jgi:hypothetical protein
MAAQRGWQQPGQCRQHRAVGPTRLRAGDLAPQHHHLVPEDHNLRVLGCLAAAKQDQPAEDPDRDQIHQTDEHKPRSCRNPSALAKPQATNNPKSSEAVQVAG